VTAPVMSPQSRPAPAQALRDGPPRGFAQPARRYGLPAAGPTRASSALLAAAARAAERAGANRYGHADQAGALAAGARSANTNSLKEMFGLEVICLSPALYPRCVFFLRRLCCA